MERETDLIRDSSTIVEEDPDLMDAPSTGEDYDRTSAYMTVRAWQESDNCSTAMVLQALQESDLVYCYAIHDRDNCKPHSHFIVKMGSPKRRSQLARILGIEKHNIRPCDVTGMSKYLTHDTPRCRAKGKTAYSPEEVVDPFGFYKTTRQTPEEKIAVKASKWTTLATAVNEWVVDEGSDCSYLSLFCYLATRIDVDDFNSTQMHYVYKEAHDKREVYLAHRDRDRERIDHEAYMKNLGERAAQLLKEQMEE